jgi:peptide-methionine (R)-S-oxide reductase
MKFWLTAGGLAVLWACAPKEEPAKMEESMPAKTKSKVSEDEWKKRLTPEQYYVCRQKGTEAAYSGKYDTFFEPGVYRCTCCGSELFSSKEKYNSGCGWPSFWAPIAEGHVDFNPATLEATCHECGSHLGHVFDDGPPPTGKRY